MDHQNLHEGQSRRLKRMRSDGPLRPLFTDSQPTPDPNELDADLQNSIRMQDAASKRARLSRSVNDSGSPIADRRRSRFVEGSMRDAASKVPPGDFLMADGDRSAPNSGLSAAFRNALTPVWSGVSGIFGRKSSRGLTASTNTPNSAASSSGVKFGEQDGPRTHSSQSDHSSAKDSGIYLFGARASLDQKPSAPASLDHPVNTLRAALNHSPTAPPAAAFSPQAGDDELDISPFKRLHRASVSSLRKMRSHLGMSSLRRAASPAKNQSPMKFESPPAVPAIPIQFANVNAPKSDVKKRQKLMKKMSNLQSQLEQCKQEYSEMFASEASPQDVTGDSSIEHDKSKREMPEISTAPAFSQLARPLPAPPVFVRTARSPASHPTPTMIDWDPSASPSKPNGKLTALPAVPPSPQKKPLPAVPTIEQAPVVESSSAPALADDALTQDVQMSYNPWNYERDRRSLSTILSSRAGSPEPLGEIQPAESRSFTRSTPAKQSSYPTGQAYQNSTITAEDASKQENMRIAMASPGKESKDNTGNSIKLSRIPRHSPRKPRNDPSDLPTISAIRSPPRRADGISGGSPRKRSETDGVKKRRSKKKSVGAEDLGHYDAAGDWIWGEETF